MSPLASVGESERATSGFLPSPVGHGRVMDLRPYPPPPLPATAPARPSPPIPTPIPALPRTCSPPHLLAPARTCPHLPAHARSSRCTPPLITHIGEIRFHSTCRFTDYTVTDILLIAFAVYSLRIVLRNIFYVKSIYFLARITCVFHDPEGTVMYSI